MGFPDIRSFPLSHPGPYERQMGEMIARLLRLFQGRVPDRESSERVLELVSTQDRWSAAHKLFDEVRTRLNRTADVTEQYQYSLEESCLQAIYNATDAQDPFDSCAPFFITIQAIGLARVVGLNDADVIAALLSP
jgi:hypothetical protein